MYQYDSLKVKFHLVAVIMDQAQVEEQQGIINLFGIILIWT